MKITRTALLALLLLGSLAGAGFAQTSISAGIHIGPSGQSSVDLGFFYDDLAQYGNWIERPNYGWAWTPRDVSADWRPYEDGHWVNSDQGWTWITDEPYGWATYHYGRWYEDPEIGWSWVPGEQWAPSWVSWQEGGDYIGWAPLPPSVSLSVGFNGILSVSLAQDAYIFVPERYFLAPRLTTYIVPRARVGTFFRNTRNYSNYRYSGDRIYNQGVPIDRIQRAVGRPVTRYQLADLAGDQRRSGARVQGNRVEIFRPQVQRAKVTPPSSRPAARAAVVSAAQFRAKNPNRAARRAAAQGTDRPAVQQQPARPAAQPKPAQAPRAERQQKPQVRPQVQRQQPAVQQQRPQVAPQRQQQPPKQRQQAAPQKQQRQKAQAPPQRQKQPPKAAPQPQKGQQRGKQQKEKEKEHGKPPL
ncbi:MAG TPA: DUF6600 domain-containing protein [Thermoanaerobaculia bacterium]|jgi:hypothetical protein|nr:DUF6600 domain-containing protein [Thermoanaerobaculia bacterium]